MEHVTCINLIDEQASKQFAVHLAKVIKSPLVITLSGDIGTGKTTIIRAMLKALGIESAIKSPTFSLVESYECDTFTVHHFDLYRIHHEDELEYLGFRDYFSLDSVCCIEWAEHGGQVIPEVDIRLKLTVDGMGRKLEMAAFSAAGHKVIACLIGE
jgi:tRNA threonylcarbamoyladenosine biosynthesis protein TsaE